MDDIKKPSKGDTETVKIKIKIYNYILKFK